MNNNQNGGSKFGKKGLPLRPAPSPIIPNTGGKSVSIKPITQPIPPKK
jgi:hypothetical protein